MIPRLSHFVQRCLGIALLGVALSAVHSPVLAEGSHLRDDAEMFSPDARKQAESTLTEFQAKSRLPVTVQTKLTAGSENPAKFAQNLAKTEAGKGLYVLILKNDRKIEVLWSGTFSKQITNDDRDRIRSAITAEFKTGNYDAGLLKGLDAIRPVAQRFPVGGPDARPVPANSPPMNNRGNAPAAQKPGGGMSLMVLLMMGVGVLVLIRIIGGIFGGRSSYGGGMPPGRGPSGMGPGGGYGGGGYGGGYGGGGGGGGGFFQGMMGGLGGALLGNWAYDRLSGHNHGHQNHDSMGSNMGAGSWSSPSPDTSSEPKDDQWFGGDSGGDWGGSGADSGGWSGSDGGGDWGGGGDIGGGGGSDW